MIGHRDDDVPVRRLESWREKLTQTAVFIHGTRGGDLPFVPQKGEREKRGLMDQTLAAPVKAAFTLQLADEFPSQTSHRPLSAQQFVVKVEHRARQTGTQTKRRTPHPWS